MRVYEEFIKKDNLINGTHVRVSVFFSNGGKSVMSGEILPSGYYACVGPFTKDGQQISFRLFSAETRLIMTAGGYSDEQFDIAVGKSNRIIPAMIEKLTINDSKAA